MAEETSNVAIIGAGLSGLSLALALNQQKISCTIYESRPAPLNIGGAVMLSPNALQVLNALGVYDRVRVKGYNFETLDYRNSEGELSETYEFGSAKKYGFKALRIYRYVLIDELIAMLNEKNIHVEFGKKFVRIVSETEGLVTWEWADGTQQTASLIVGADGIHSTVRKYLYPDLTPKFIGMAGITAAVPTKQLNLPGGYHIPVTITSKKSGFVIAPQEIDGSEVLIGKQKRIEDRDRAGWEAYLADKASLVEFLQEDAEEFPEFVQNAVSNISHDKINVWPFYIVPKLEKWTSPQRRVIILGDAAHAIPPSAGQGINQAFEDVFMFALLLAETKSNVGMQDALTFWQDYRQNRIEKVMDLNRQIDLRRMPKDEVAEVDSEEFQLAWLYSPDFKAVIDEWAACRSI